MTALLPAHDTPSPERSAYRHVGASVRASRFTGLGLPWCTICVVSRYEGHMIRGSAIVVLVSLSAVMLVSCSSKSAPTVQLPISSVPQPSPRSATRDSTDQLSAPEVITTPLKSIEPCVTMDSIVMDLSCGATFRFTIGPNLPQFTFKITPDVREPVNGFPQSTVRDIEVFRGDSSQPSQRLTGCDLREMEPPPSAATDPAWFHSEDVNFDGFQDIYLMTFWGATGNQGGCVWLYDRTTGRFDYSKEFSELGRHWSDPATKTIVTFGVGGMAGMVHGGARYQIENDHLLLIYSERQDWDADAKRFHCVVQERRGTEMATTLDDSDEEGVKACDGSKLSEPRPERLILPGEGVQVIGK